MGQGLIETMTPATFEKRTQYGFEGILLESIVTYIFFPNGSLLVQDNRNTEFFFPVPKFQPDLPYNVSLLVNRPHAIHQFNVGNDTLKVWITYDVATFKKQVKVTLNGTTTDEDSEIELEFENPKDLYSCMKEHSMTIGRITYDWSDLVGATEFEAGPNKLKIKFAESFNLDPSIVSDVTGNDATAKSNLRKTAFVNERYWVFYSDGTNIVYRSSQDAGSWSSATTVTASTSGDYFSIGVYSNNIHYVLFDNGLKYRMGACGDQFISWATTETEIAETGNTDYCNIACDSNGFPYIVYCAGATYWNVTKSEYKNGTWSTASGYPKQLSEGACVWYWAGSIVPLQGGKMYAVYSNASSGAIDNFYGKLYDGASWGSEELISSTTSMLCWAHSVIAYGNDVYVVFANTNSQPVHVIRTYGAGWGNETEWSVTRPYSVLIKASNTANAEIYMFAISSKTVYYRMYADGSWSNELQWSEAMKLQSDSLSGYYEYANGEVGVCYTTQLSPYIVKFHTIGTYQPVPWVDPSGGDVDLNRDIENGEEPFLPSVPRWGYIIIFGSLGLVLIGGILMTPPKRRRVKGLKHRTRTHKPKNLKRRSKRTGRFT